MRHTIGLTMGLGGLVLAAALAGGCRRKTTASQYVRIGPAGGMGDVAEPPEEYLQRLYDSVDWKAVFVDAVRDPALAAAGWQGAASEPARTLEAQTEIRQLPQTDIIEIRCTAADLPQAKAAAKAVADAYNKRYGSGIGLPGP